MSYKLISLFYIWRQSSFLKYCRLTHVESHLQYRPYRCSICGYDNRKEIFISLHIAKIHKGKGEVLFEPDSELELQYVYLFKVMQPTIFCLTIFNL